MKSARPSFSRQNYASGAYATYGYDTRSRLTSLLHRTSGGATITSETYAYNQASNLTSKVVDGATTSYGYDSIDQLTSEAAPTFTATYTYDANGWSPLP
ncbi:MAG: hypothetical protein HYR64_01755 [Fimbriimonas ginsengisoli]|uniref:RHS repeat protein n=1 Tax=Fimbriimonas ginsengisoli TaxID=1005039 RepID=A0A931PTU2_FIMGI|nr:hypothetical protein [Fimbriimonas ginsengisoli]